MPENSHPKFLVLIHKKEGVIFRVAGQVAGDGRKGFEVPAGRYRPIKKPPSGGFFITLKYTYPAPTTGGSTPGMASLGVLSS